MFFGLLGKTMTDDQLELVFPRAKAELDGHDEQAHVIKIELNDTNRPDLWSSAGVARLLKTYESQDIPRYSFFSSSSKSQPSQERKLIVGENAKDIRPYSIGFAAKGCKVTEDILLSLIQSQEKLCWNFGRKRRSIAMGIYRSDLIKYPVHYDAVDPDKTSFVPLAMTESLTLRQICEKHPKGQEYGYIVKDKPLYPYLCDDAQDALSFPPVINSARIGAVEVGDENLFIELSGTGLNDLLLAASIMACDMADFGFEILPVEVVYPYETPYGRSFTVPYYFQAPQTCTLADIRRVLGESMSESVALQALRRMGIEATAEKGVITARCPEYRNDFLHAVDIVEDVMIGYGLGRFEPQMPGDFTIGRLTPAEEKSRKIKNILVGLGFQEMMFNYLGSKKEYISNMCIDGSNCVFISNPMSENYEVVRPSVIPSLLESEAASSQAVYPHLIFEVGKTVEKFDGNDSGTLTSNTLGMLKSDAVSGYNDISSIINTLLYFLKVDYTLQPLENDPRFIPGRCATIIDARGRKIGFFGEVHPQVLENWGIAVPTTAAQINVDSLVELDTK